MEQSNSESSAAGELVQDGELNLKALSERLGPFDPPDDFDHGEEFAPATPRPIPRRLRTGSFASRRWNTVLTLFVLGVGCVIFKPIPFIERLAFHLLPLAYLDWIGYGLIALSVIAGIRSRLSRERYEYVINGDPIVGRVLGVFTPIRTVVVPHTHAVTELFRYLAIVEYVDPETQKTERIGAHTEDEWNAGKMADYDAGIDAGEYVTLVKLPDKGTDSIKLYGFLGLDPDRDFVTKNGKPLAGVSPFAAVLISCLVLLVTWFIILAIYVFIYCIPREEPDAATGILFFVGGGAAGALLSAWMVWSRQRKRQTPKLRGVVSAGFMGGVIGMLAGAVTLGSINSAFDHTQPRYEPIRITQHWQTTYEFVFCTYEIEYTPLAGGKSEMRGTSFDDLEKLDSATLGALEIRQGALGLDWIAAVHPVEWFTIENENPSPEELRDGVEVHPPAPAEAGAIAIKLVPRLLLDLEGNNVPCPAELTDAAINDLQSNLSAKGTKVVRLQP